MKGGHDAQSNIDEQDFLSLHDDASRATIVPGIAVFEGVNAAQHHASIVIPRQSDFGRGNGVIQELGTFGLAFFAGPAHGNFSGLDAVNPVPDDAEKQNQGEQIKSVHVSALSLQRDQFIRLLAILTHLDNADFGDVMTCWLRVGTSHSPAWKANIRHCAGQTFRLRRINFCPLAIATALAEELLYGMRAMQLLDSVTAPLLHGYVFPALSERRLNILRQQEQMIRIKR